MHGERAELEDEKYISLANVLEGRMTAHSSVEMSTHTDSHCAYTKYFPKGR